MSSFIHILISILQFDLEIALLYDLQINNAELRNHQIRILIK